jgi:hypothetical protein
MDLDELIETLKGYDRVHANLRMELSDPRDYFNSIGISFYTHINAAMYPLPLAYERDGGEFFMMTTGEQFGDIARRLEEKPYFIMAYKGNIGKRFVLEGDVY